MSHEPSKSLSVPSPALPRRDGGFAAMAERAERLRWRRVAQARRSLPIRTLAAPLLILVSPLILLVLSVGVFLPGRFRVNPALLMLSFGALLDAWGRGSDQGRG
ncbi:MULTISPECIES: hypothetical protein [Phenylobacterium]|uniref:ABC transporter permease n=1 Tax=Phenylobacterium conjunctum TaxID=1298959 RepID=A0ABW3SZU4_9CAUL